MGTLLGGLLLLTVLSVIPIQGCASTEQDLSLDNQLVSPGQSQSSSPTPLISQSPMLPQAIADKVLNDLAQSTGEPVSTFTIQSSENKTWPDSCLGLAQEGQMCAQVMIPGWRVVVESGSKKWIYRTNQNGRTILLES
ncbi:hypothetical protein D082_19240 [Synechocystis sp. PCC 6714]|nr:hypothetical protein D082_19240 [Synechocystis sp. PCC 6714]